MFPLFSSLEQESIVTEEGDYVTQSFVIRDASMAEMASRALGTLLRLSTGEDEAHWRRALEQSRAAPFAPSGLKEAANQALESGFLQYGLNLQPHVVPPFLAALRSGSDR